MNLIQFLLRKSSRVMAWSLFAGVVSGASNSILLAIISAVLKVNGNSSRLLLSGFIGLWVVLPASRYASEILLSRLGQAALYSLRMELSRQILAAPLRHLEQLGSARLLAALTDDVPAVTGAIMTIPLLCVSIAVVIGCLVYMGFMSRPLVAIVVVFMAVGVLGYQFPMLRAQRAFRKARQDVELLMEDFRAMTYGAKELKIHSERRKAFLQDVLSETAASLSRHSLSGMKIHTIAASWGQTIVFALIGLIVFVFSSWAHLSGQVLTAYTLALLYIMSPLQVIMNQLPTLSRASVALRRVQELGFRLSSKEGEEVCESPAPAGAWQTLELISVSHAYRGEGEDHVFALGPISATFHTGELVFITGGNGSGKTTLGKLLCGLYVPDKGRICLDGQPVVSQVERECYRQHFAVVFSDCFVFDRMLGLFGPALNELAAEYLGKLELAHKVRVKDGKLSTVELSQGQRKRLALLTAFLEDRQIYLFDEWAADQDPHFKAMFYLELLPQLKARKKTVFVISHDDRYYGCADRLIKLDTGKIVSDTRGTSPEDENVLLTQRSCEE